MTSAATSGTPGPGTGPAPVSSFFSDRVGGESSDGSSMSMNVDPLARVLRTLDQITAAEGEVGTGVRADFDTSADGSAAPASTVSEADGGAPAPDGSEPGAVRTVELEEAATTPVTTGPGQARREAILDAASSLFAERGYHGASLRDISRRAGISHPGMLHHFASKDTLLGAVIDRLEDHAQGLLNSVESIQGSPATLIAALSGPWDPTQHEMALLATLSAETVNPDHPGRYRVARLRLVHEHVLEKALIGLSEQGQLVPGAQPAFVARSLFSLLLSLTVREHSVRELQQDRSADPSRDVHDFVRLCVVS
ncbi:TetR/AcrR family transcriptional regulator [Brachybacterium sp. JB7]|uniref:TetR family transcriptional regulator n=2 Tax=Dermabacteraceae TaxID=85020 RepID=A0A2A3YHD5_9MICO|nr:TetR family transcriptional regulator [Brachybacterium alimentarium]RCS61680.1 TetR/AcrR family transcriptional regulator [Brachybacterium sp. JB7]PCC38515.1 TetR family transcriptional regulator [Brachybacterium alimentarium]RCS63427.1 TetR/AcrR family transcriptional regulator [Brachybacterium alimentarium]RCS67473.1 TetR/AcrR family transcriptional regulator [Brachybacterium alimentarium]